jgi:putative ABC transport system permease protein
VRNRLPVVCVYVLGRVPLTSLLHDLRIGLRLLWKDKAFTATTLLTLALCIGANTALFSVIHNVLLRPLAIPEAERIVTVSNLYPKAGAAAAKYGNVGVPDYLDRKKQVSVFEENALYRYGRPAIEQKGSPVRLRSQSVTPSFFRVLRAQAALGRTFSEDEGNPGNDRKVILSYGLWQSQFGGAQDVVGRELRLDGNAYAVIGVMPRAFQFLSADVMLWTPLAFTAQQKSDNGRHNNNWTEIARLKPGASLEQAQSQVDAVNLSIIEAIPGLKPLLINAGFHSSVIFLQEMLVRDVKATLYLMWGGALFVLLIGCVNVANLVLVRSRVRLKELATRLALGAGRWRIARQLITESVLLTIISAIAGLLVGYLALTALGTLSLSDLPRAAEIRLDGVVIAWTLATSAVIGMVLGLIPVAAVLPLNLTTVLREEGRSGTAARGARTVRRALVVMQVAFAFVLLIGAGLLFASFRRVLAVDPGFNGDGVMTASISLPGARYKDDAAITAFYDEALRRMRAIPGVKAAGATDTIPFGGNNSNGVIFAEGYQMGAGESVLAPNGVTITPGYFNAMNVRLVRGRFFTDADRAKSLPVIIIDEKLANHFWPGQDPLGRRMYRPNGPEDVGKVTDKTVFLTIVGVVREMTLHDLTEEQGAVGAVFAPQAQSSFDRNMTFAVATSGNPEALAGPMREVITQLDRELPVSEMQSMDDRLDKSLVTRRSPMVLSLMFGAVALFLSAIGIYGVLAYLVAQRRKEIGIRLALGSSNGAIFELVLREGLLLIGGGLAIGAIGALVLRKSLESQLFGVHASDPLVLAVVTTVLALVAIIAVAVPARRATKIDPIIALTE